MHMLCLMPQSQPPTHWRGPAAQVAGPFHRYTPYPDPRSHRIQLQQLAEPGIIERLRAI